MKRVLLLTALVFLTSKTFSQQDIWSSETQEGHSIVWLSEAAARRVAKDLIAGDLAHKKVIEYEGLLNLLNGKIDTKDGIINNKDRQIIILRTQTMIEDTRADILEQNNQELRKKIKKQRFQKLMIGLAGAAGIYVGYQVGKGLN